MTWKFRFSWFTKLQICNQQMSTLEFLDGYLSWKCMTTRWIQIHISWWRHQMETFSALLVNSPHRGQWRRALIFSLICARIIGWVNNREAGDLPSRLFWRHCNVFVIYVAALCKPSCNLVAPSSILIIRLYVATNFLHKIFSCGISWFLSNLFSAENQLRYLVVTLPKRVSGHPEVFLSCLSAAVLHA